MSARRSLVWVSVPRLTSESAGETRASADAPKRALREHGPDPERVRTRRPIAFGLGALGLGGLAAGTVFALKYRSSNDAAEGICTSTPACPAEQIARHDTLTREARAARNGAYVSFGVGAAALAGAAFAYFGVPLYRSEGARVSARPAYGADGTLAVTAEGAF